MSFHKFNLKELPTKNSLNLLVNSVCNNEKDTNDNEKTSVIRNLPFKSFFLKKMKSEPIM